MTNASKAAEAVREKASRIKFEAFPKWWREQTDAGKAGLGYRVGSESAFLAGVEAGVSASPAESPNHEALRTALLHLKNEVGALAAFEPFVREAIGNTNYHVLMLRVREAEQALDAATPAPDERRSAAEIRAEIERLRAELSRPGLWDRILVEEHIAALEWTLAPPKPPAVKET